MPKKCPLWHGRSRTMPTRTFHICTHKQQMTDYWTHWSPRTPPLSVMFCWFCNSSCSYLPSFNAHILPAYLSTLLYVCFILSMPKWAWRHEHYLFIITGMTTVLWWPILPTHITCIHNFIFKQDYISMLTSDLCKMWHMGWHNPQH